MTDKEYWEKQYEAELANAEKMVEDWLNTNSDDELVQKLLDEDELSKEEAKERAISTAKFAAESLAKLTIHTQAIKEE